MKRFALYALALALVLSLGLMVSPGPASAKTVFVTIGTGGITGVYYPTGGAIAKMINKKRKEYGIRATVESTGGSVFNVNAIMAGDLEFGVVQSDCQYQAINGLAEWKDKGPQKDLRSVFTIHPESITLVAGDDTDINTLADLKGKRVNIGNPGSGQRQNSIDALVEGGLDFEKDLTAEGVKAAEAPGLLQDGRIDAFFYTVGHPNGAIKEATAGKRKVHFVPITVSDEFLKKFPYYARAVVPIEFYDTASNKEDVPTFGVKATFVTSAKVPDEVVYAITKEVFDNFEEFKKLHPAYVVLTKENMLEGMSAPVHPGAMKYYIESGLDKFLKRDIFSYDFNNDGKSDILCRNPTNGKVGVWLMNGTTEDTWAYIGNHGTYWDARGVGDFNGDGSSDIVFRNNNGMVGVWLMDGTTEDTWLSLGNHGTAWDVKGVGDFNGDGHNDVVYRNINGMVGLWLMNGLTEDTWHALGNHGTAWNVKGVGDFNDDGHPDVLYSNANGKVGVWLMNGVTESTWKYLGNHGTNWQPEGVADYNNDGKVDVVYQNIYGDVGVWLMTGTAETTWKYIANHGVWEVR